MSLYEALPAVQAAEIETLREHLLGKKKKSLQSKYKSQIAKESRLIPALIFAIEGWEGSVLKMNTVFKVKVVKGFHRSTARDFRINPEQLRLIDDTLEQGNQVDDSDHEETHSNLANGDSSGADYDMNDSMLIDNGESLILSNPLS